MQVGSIFEFANRNAIFGALPPSSPFYAPILLTFALTGLPSAGACAYGACRPALLGCSRRTALQARGTRAQGTCSSRQSVRRTKRRNAKTRRTVSRQPAEQDSLQGQDAVKRVHTLSHCKLHLPTRSHRMGQGQAAARGHACCQRACTSLAAGQQGLRVEQKPARAAQHATRAESTCWPPTSGSTGTLAVLASR